MCIWAIHSREVAMSMHLLIFTIQMIQVLYEDIALVNKRKSLTMSKKIMQILKCGSRWWRSVIFSNKVVLEKDYLRSPRQKAIEIPKLWRSGRNRWKWSLWALKEVGILTFYFPDAEDRYLPAARKAFKERKVKQILKQLHCG